MALIPIQPMSGNGAGFKGRHRLANRPVSQPVPAAIQSQDAHGLQPGMVAGLVIVLACLGFFNKRLEWIMCRFLLYLCETFKQ